MLHVGGRAYRNSAAKFWPALLDEALDHFPACTSMELVAPAPAHLDRHVLFPACALERALNDMRVANARAELAQTLAELALLGGPASVMLRLLEDGHPRHAQELPPDCLDAETLQYLVGWLLEWAGLAAEDWNRPAVSGAVDAEDSRRQRRYRFAFALTRRPLSEGLEQWTLQVDLAAARGQNSEDGIRNAETPDS